MLIALYGKGSINIEKRKKNVVYFLRFTSFNSLFKFISSHIQG